jgi:hypothetical protein
MNRAMTRDENTFSGLMALSALILVYAYYSEFDNKPLHLIELFALPITFAICAFFVEKHQDSGFQLNRYIVFAGHGLSKGASGAFVLLSYLTLDQWYAHPDLAYSEPLFTAQGLIAAILAGISRFFKKQVTANV